MSVFYYSNWLFYYLLYIIDVVRSNALSPAKRARHISPGPIFVNYTSNPSSVIFWAFLRRCSLYTPGYIHLVLFRFDNRNHPVSIPHHPLKRYRRK